jgi:methylated-DNA-[protein]-cysteine S-methyltransferase
VSANVHNIHSPLGNIEISASENEIMSISFRVESDHFRVNEITTLTRECKAQLDAYFTGKLKKFDLPLNIKGTTFQQQVWHQLKQIPYAETISYKKLSEMLGNPKAIRAAGSANGNNPFAIVVPCHRVIGSHGEMTGYSGKLWRKKWLLDHEAKFGKGILTLFDSDPCLTIDQTTGFSSR